MGVSEYRHYLKLWKKIGSFLNEREDQGSGSETFHLPRLSTWGEASTWDWERKPRSVCGARNQVQRNASETRRQWVSKSNAATESGKVKLGTDLGFSNMAVTATVTRTGLGGCQQFNPDWRRMKRNGKACFTVPSEVYGLLYVGSRWTG